MAKFIELIDIAVGSMFVNIDTIEMIYTNQNETKIIFQQNSSGGSVVTVKESYAEVKSKILHELS